MFPWLSLQPSKEAAGGPPALTQAQTPAEGPRVDRAAQSTAFRAREPAEGPPTRSSARTNGAWLLPAGAPDTGSGGRRGSPAASMERLETQER